MNEKKNSLIYFEEKNLIELIVNWIKQAVKLEDGKKKYSTEKIRKLKHRVI